MAGKYFRWWYLLLLLIPVLLYLAARLYVDSRIQSALTAANQNGNELTLGRYGFSLLPLGLTVDSVTFCQERSAFSAAGTLGHGELSGVSLLPLLRGGHYEIDRLRLDGLSADLTLHDRADSSGQRPDVRLDRFTATGSRLRLHQKATGRSLLLSGAEVEHRDFHLPFSPDQLARTTFAGDTLLLEQGDQFELLALQPTLNREDVGQLTARQLDAQRTTPGTAFDLRATDLLVALTDFTQLSTDSLRLDRLRAATLAGHLTLADSSTTTPTSSPTLHLDRTELPVVDLRVSGPFGRATVVEGALQQDDLTYPLAAAPPGATVLESDTLTLVLGERTLNVTDLRYVSEEDRLTTAAGSVDLPDRTATASWATATVTGVPRQALLRGKPPVVGELTWTQATLSLTNEAGSRYRASAPAASVRTLGLGDDPSAAGLRLENTRLRRYDQDGELRLDVRGGYLTQGRLDLRQPLHDPGPTQLRTGEVLLVDESLAANYRFFGIHYDSPDGAATADSIHRRSDEPVASILRTTDEKSVVEFTTGRVAVRGLDHRGLVRRERGRADSVSVDGFRLIAMEDPAKPPSPDYRPLPLEALRQLPLPIAIDRFLVREAEIEYAIVSKSYEPKSIYFRDADIAIEGLRTAVSTTDSIIATMDCTFQRATPVSIRFALSRSASGRDYGMSGSMGHYDLTDINPLMDVAARVTIESGVVDTLRYVGQLRGDTLRGDLTFLYHDLDVSPQGAMGFFKNIAAGLVVKAENTRQDFRPGTMFFTYDDSRSFFNIYWRGLVSGMKSSALGNIALPDELEVERK